MNQKRISRKRGRLARALERAAVPERPFRGSGPLYLVHPRVTAACAPSLRAIAAGLREEMIVLDEADFRAVLMFITNGDSPFFGQDTTSAKSAAKRLENMVLEVQMAVPDAPSVDPKLHALYEGAAACSQAG